MRQREFIAVLGGRAVARPLDEVSLGTSG